MSPGSPPTPCTERTSLVARGISKRYLGVRALDRVDFTLHPGEIHGLLGENGAGKSTLMSVLAGIVRPDEGSVTVAGHPLRPGSPADAAAAGIGMVHQHFSLIPTLTVAENLSLALGTGPAIYRLPDSLAGTGLAMAQRFGWEFDPDTPVWQLNIGRQQRLEILKTLQRGARWLLFDEPTAVLSPSEVDELFPFLERLREEGRSVVFISHKLEEARRLCDRITVLHHGRVVGERPHGTSASELARLMVGEGPAAGPDRGANLHPALTPGPSPNDWERGACSYSPDLFPTRPVVGRGGQGVRARPPEGEQPALVVRHLRVRDDRGAETVRDLTFQVERGEIFGVAGVDGNGQAELAEAVVGLRKPMAGAVSLPARDAAAGTADSRRRVGYIPQDRRRAGLVLPMSVRENLALEIHAAPEFRWGPFLRQPPLWAKTRALVRQFDIRVADDRLPASALSGGNQQKIVVARALGGARSLVVAVNPTRGLDLRSTAFVHEQLRAASKAGVGVLLISTDLDEVVSLSRRIGVLFGGSFQDIVPPTSPRAVLGRLMGGAAGRKTPG